MLQMVVVGISMKRVRIIPVTLLRKKAANA